MKKLILIPVMIMFAVTSQPVHAEKFKDVEYNHWGGICDQIEYLQSMGIMEGYPDNTFRGDQLVTRYEVAIVLARIFARLDECYNLLLDDPEYESGCDSYSITETARIADRECVLDEIEV